MRLNNLLIVLFIISVVMSCKKNSDIKPPTLTTKWVLVNDSMIYGNVFDKPSSHNYKGLPGDYFDFRADGKCYTKEGNNYDTLTYKMLTDTTAVIQDFGLNNSGIDNYHSVINPLTYHNATITSPDFLFPGAGNGGSHRIVSLKR